MYCSACGVAVAQNLSYCNYCGAKLSDANTGNAGKFPDVNPESLLRLMASVFILGTFVITLLMGMMKAVLRLEAPLILASALLPFLVMLLLEAVFIRILFLRKLDPEKASNAQLLKEKATKELDGSTERLLAEPLLSVTDQTTRTLETVYSERKSK